jgi:hypothetical protein
MQIKVLTKLTEMAEILPGGERWNWQRSAKDGTCCLRWVRLVDSSNCT